MLPNLTIYFMLYTVQGGVGMERKRINPPDLTSLLEGISEGDWVLLSYDSSRMVAYGPDIHDVFERANAAYTGAFIVIRKNTLGARFYDE